MDEPRGRSVVVNFAKYIVVLRWVWRRQPLPRRLLRPVACKAVSIVIQISGSGARLTLRLIYVACDSLHDDLHPTSVAPTRENKSNVPSDCRMSLIDACPSNRKEPQNGMPA